MDNGERQNRISGLVRRSRIVSGLNSFSDRLADAFRKSLFGSFFLSADALDRKVSESFFVSVIGKRVCGFFSTVRRFFMKSVSGSFVSSALQSVFIHLRSMYAAVFGTFTLAFSLYTALVGFLLRFVAERKDVSALYFILPAALIPASVVLLFAKRKRIGDLLISGVITGSLLFGVFGLRRSSFRPARVPGGRKNVAFIAGVILGALTFFVNPLYVILILPAFLFVALVFHSPESGLIITLFLIPFLIVAGHPSVLLAVFMGLLLVAFLTKALRGKRTVSFCATDLFLCIFAAVFMLGGLFGFGGSFPMSLPLYLVLMLGYFMCANLCSTQVWLRRSVIALLAGAAITSVFGIYQYLTGNVDTVWLDTENFSSIAGRAVSFFENPNMLGEFVMMLFLPACVMTVTAGTWKGKLAGAVTSALLLGCLVVTWARGAWLGMLFGAVIFLLTVNRRSVTVFVLLLVILPFLPVVLPESIVSRFTSIGDMTDSSTSYRFYIWKSAIAMMRDFGLGGIGAGADNFVSVYHAYSYSGVESAHHAHSLFFQLIIETGVPGILTFMLFCLTYVRRVISFAADTASRTLALVAASCMSGVLASLVQGATDYTWYNYRVFCVFFIIAGIGTAAVRCGRKEKSGDTGYTVNDENRAETDFTPEIISTEGDNNG